MSYITKRVLLSATSALLAMSSQPAQYCTLETQSQGSGSVAIVEPEGEGPTRLMEAGTKAVIEITADDDAVIQNVTVNDESLDEYIGKTDETLELTVDTDTNVSVSFRTPEYRPFELTDEEVRILEQYKAGDTQSAKAVRRQKALEHGLQDAVDEDWFLRTDYMYERGNYFTANDGMIILTNPNQPAKRKAQAHAGTLNTVYDYQSYTWQHPYNGYYTTSIWVADIEGIGSVEGFCANGEYALPLPGTTIVGCHETNNENLRKVLYYGYNGPDNRLAAKGMSVAQQISYTADFVSYAASGQSVGTLFSNGFLWNLVFSSVYNELTSLPSPPASYKAYIADVSGEGESWTNTIKPKQPIAFGIDRPKGKVRLHKSTKQAELSDDNEAYDLQGAEYVIKDSSGKEAARLVTKSDGTTDAVELDQGSYTCHEVKAPQGFELSEESYSFTVDGDKELKTVETSDQPLYDVPELIVQKSDDKDMPLENAQFELKFFKQGQKEADRTWELVSDKEGRIILDDEHKVAGDDFYKDRKGRSVLPAGTLTIRETKAPDGYKLDEAITTTTVEISDDNQIIKLEPVHAVNEPVAITFTKKQSGTDTVLEGVEFEHEMPDGTKETVKTDKNGQITLQPLKNGIHKLTEIKALPGYELLSEPIEFEVKDNKVEFEEATIKNETMPATLEIVKTNDEDAPLKGALFALYDDEACVEPLQQAESDEEGRVQFEGLKNGKDYWVRELKAPVGYRLPEQPVTKLNLAWNPAEGKTQITINNQIVSEDESVDASLEDGRLNVQLVKVNLPVSTLPKTGKNLWIVPVGALAVMALLRKKQ